MHDVMEKSPSYLLDRSETLLSEYNIFTKYARHQPELQRRENYREIVTRNREGHREQLDRLGLSPQKAALANEYLDSAYELVYDRRLLSSMRSMQFMGKALHRNNARMYNCSYAPITDIRIFAEAMFLLLSGCGFGYSVQKHHVSQLPVFHPTTHHPKYTHVIEDSIEGWADSIYELLMSYVDGDRRIEFDYSQIRDKGSRLITSGGRAPGASPLRKCHQHIIDLLDEATKEGPTKLRTIQAHDVLCHQAMAVLSGGIRRAAMIALFSYDDDEMRGCKSDFNWFTENEQRKTANNSGCFYHQDSMMTPDLFREYCQEGGMRLFGEPGIFWSNDPECNDGLNPCAEISLRPYGFCNLVEINARPIQTQRELNRVCYLAGILGKMQASYTDFTYLSDRWRKTAEEDSLLGVSFTGIMDNPKMHGVERKGNGWSFKKEGVFNLSEAATFVNNGDEVMAGLLGIRTSKRNTAIKPSGTTSCVLGTASGRHRRHSSTYIRRVRGKKDDGAYEYLRSKLPLLMADLISEYEDDGYVFSIPQSSPEGSLLIDSLDMDLAITKKLYNEWIVPGHKSGNNTHNVSTTLSVRDHEWDGLITWLWENRKSYTALSFFPHFDAQNSEYSFRQLPFEKVSEDVHEVLNRVLGETEIDFNDIVESDDMTSLVQSVACSGGSCEI